MPNKHIILRRQRGDPERDAADDEPMALPLETTKPGTTEVVAGLANAPSWARTGLAGPYGGQMALVP